MGNDMIYGIQFQHNVDHIDKNYVAFGNAVYVH